MSGKTLSYAADLIRGVQEHIAPGVPDNRTRLVISRAEEGTLFLDEQDALAYGNTVGRLLQDFAKAGDLSRRSVEQHLQEALFKSLDIRHQRQEPFDERLTGAVTELRSRLSGVPISYRCFVPVCGLEPQDLPLAFGGVRFVKFGESHQRELLKPLAGGSKLKGFRRLVNDLRQNELWGSPCAVVSVAARDSDSAAIRAQLATRARVDCINFFADLIPYNHGWLYLPGEATRALQTAPVVSSDGRVTLPHSVAGPIAPLSLENLRKYRRVLRHWKTVSALARTVSAKTGGEVLLTSLQWAGRASVEPKREQRFLLFAIALETAVLPDHAQELDYRLRLRASRILGGDRERRFETRRSIAGLYAIRSKIVHSGSYEVTDEDLGRLRWLTKSVLLRLLHKRQLWHRSSKELGAWLESLVTR